MPSTPRSRASFSLDSTTFVHASEPEDRPRKPWYHYLPLLGTVFLILAPQPSILIVLVQQHLRLSASPATFIGHLVAVYTLTFLIFTSLIICVARDPGPMESTVVREGAEIGLTEALAADFDFSAPGKWCRTCWSPKPERTHHCTHCGRCVLKMDHHCPWLGSKCIGHRTYPAFIHFLFCVTLLSIYVASMSVFVVMFAFQNPYKVDGITPIHAIGLFFYGAVFTLVVGSFFIYHLYLTFTNQTTIESLSPFLLLRELPANIPIPMLEHELSYPQRRLVKDAHSHLRLYDIGWKKNFQQVFGWSTPYGWVYRLLGGGACVGSGKSWPRNPHSDDILARLAKELVDIERDRR